jgi:hypothetical protein
MVYCKPMKITNHYGLPETLVRAVLDDEYDRGDSVMSVTQLIAPPRVVLLQNVNADKLEQDVVQRVPALLGTAVHKIIEKGSAGVPGHIVEERMFAEVLGWKISGAVDLQIDKGDGTWAINDWKVTSVYSVISDKPEWEQQLNCYAYLSYLAHGRVVSSLKIVAILRDWQRKQAELKPDYPQAQIAVVDIPVWTPMQQKTFVEDRVALHQAAQKAVDNGEPLAYCTDQERWVRGESWALMKEGRKSAIKIHDSKEAAEQHLADIGAAAHWVEHRPGNAIRCSGNYCLVSQWCRQYQEELSGGAGGGSGGMPERHDE